MDSTSADIDSLEKLIYASGLASNVRIRHRTTLVNSCSGFAINQLSTHKWLLQAFSPIIEVVNRGSG